MTDSNAIVARLREQAARDAMRVTAHAHEEMVEENVNSVNSVNSGTVT